MMPTPHRTRTGLPLEARNGRPNHPPEAWTLGRDVGNDLVIDHPLVSRHHARIRRGAEGFVLEDLGSTNGTFVDGRRSLRTVLRPGDRFSVASQSFYLDQSGEPRRYDQDRSLTLEAAGLRVDKAVGRHRVITLIDGISLTIGPSQVVGLMGPSGSGKTTLLESLNGYLPPSAGQVLLNQRDLYEHFDRFRLDIGYVPQDDILHSQLRVRDALFYSARLRLPPDTRNREIDLRIERVLDQLGLAEVADRRIGSPADKDKVLSGGQRKRVNMALELLTEPWLLFLDEPTSGLSSADALQVLRVLRRLADQGRTVVLSIHQPSLEVFRQMTHVAMLAKDPGSPEPARLAYFGPAFPDSLRFFNRDLPPILDTGPPVTPEILFDGLQKHSTAEWVRRFAASPYAAQPQRVRRAPQGPGRSAVARDSGLHQWWSLLQRDLAIKRRDSQHTLILLAQAPLIGLLIIGAFGANARAPVTGESFARTSQSAATAIFLMVIATLWFGCSNAAREIVAEQAVFHRERMVNLKVSSYLIAKLAMLGLLGLVQCSALLLVVGQGCALVGDRWRTLFLLWLAALVGTGLGLGLSAIARTSEVAISLVPLVLLPMVVLGGAMQPVHGLKQPARSLAQAMASRWAFEGLIALEGAARPGVLSPVGPTLEAGTSPRATGGLARAVVKKVDLAEHYFPLTERNPPSAGARALATMFFGLVTAIAWILRLRGRSR